MEATKPPLDPVAAKSKTERLLKFRDYIQKLLLAYASGDMENLEHFGLLPWEYKMLEEVYNDTLAEMGHIPKWVDMMIVESMVLIPRIMKVRSFRKVKAELEESKAKIARLERQAASHFHAPEPSNEDFRTDAKKWWELDAEGFFMYDKSGYLSKEKKVHKPDVTDEHQYAMAVKYNGKDKIHEIFKINTGA